MDFPVIKNFFTGFFRHLPGEASANFVDGKSIPAISVGVARHHEDCPFVLVAHGADGQWEVYAKDFEHPLASFTEKQAGCDFATDLANSRENSIVLIRDLQSLR